MVRQCQVCKRTDLVPGYSFHKFPRDPARKKKWFNLFGFAANKPLPQRALVCSEHFDQDAFFIKENGVKYLKSGVDPNQCLIDKYRPIATRVKTEEIGSIQENFPEGPGLITAPSIKPEPEFEENSSSIPPLYKIGTMTVIDRNFQSSNQNVVYLNASSSSRHINEPTVESEPKPTQNISIVPNYSQFTTLGVQSEPKTAQNVANNRNFPQLVKIGTVADLPTNFLPSTQKLIYISDSSGLTNVPHVISQENMLTNVVVSKENMSMNLPYVISQKNISTNNPYFISQENTSKNIHKVISQENISTNIPHVISQENTSRVPKIVNVESMRYVLNCSNSSIKPQVRDSSTDSVAEAEGATSTLVNTNNLKSILKPTAPTTPTLEFGLNSLKRVTINEPIVPSTSSRLAPHQELEKKTTNGRDGSIIPQLLTIERLPNQSSLTLSDSSTDTGSEAEDETTISPLTKRRSQKPKLLQYIEETLSADNLTEEQLIEMLETDSPLLTPELMFCRRPKTSRNKRYFGDLTIDDFKTDEEKQEFIKAEKRIKENKRKISNLHQCKAHLKSKLAKTKSIVEIVASLCDVSHIKKVLEDENSDLSSDESYSSSDEDIYDEEVNNILPVNIDPAVYELHETQIDSFNLANQVQVTFSAVRETANENKLRKELDKRARKDISKSKKIKLLNNTIFMKNTVIDDLKKELEELKNAVSV